MKTIFKIVASLSFGLFAVACQQFYVDTQMTPEKAAASIKLECDALDSYTIQGEKPQSVSFKVASTTPWSITGWENAEWLKVSPASSALSSLSEDIVITAKANPDYEDRSVTLVLSGEGTDTTYKVVITQSRRGKLYVQPVSDIFEAEGNSLPFTIETNLAWEARSADQWLSFGQDKGVGDGSVQTVQAIAAANPSITRKTTVTVTAGDDKFSFEVTQKGQSLEFLPVENPEVDRRGGELLLGVKATMDWKAECDNDAFTVEKDGKDKVKVTASFNNKFAPRKAVITIKPVSDDFGDVSSQIEVTQDVNFTFEGNCEVLEDGSVKLSCGAKSKVVTKDKYRYVNIVLKLGDKHFGDKGELWCSVNANECNIYNQLSLGGNLRIRQDGNLPVTKKPSGDAVSTYNNQKYSITKDDLNAMTEYRFEVVNDITDDPDYPGVKWHVVNFWYNGKVHATMNYRSVFADDPTAEGRYWFGFYNNTSDDTWYVVKSCDVTAYAE
jgi:hypothetical protein